MSCARRGVVDETPLPLAQGAPIKCEVDSCGNIGERWGCGWPRPRAASWNRRGVSSEERQDVFRAAKVHHVIEAPQRVVQLRLRRVGLRTADGVCGNDDPVVVIDGSDDGGDHAVVCLDPRYDERLGGIACGRHSTAHTGTLSYTQRHEWTAGYKA